MSASEQQIRERAYQIWMDEGCPEGKAPEHWEKARLQLAAETWKSNEAQQPAKGGARAALASAVHAVTEKGRELTRSRRKGAPRPQA